ncbi:MAG: glutamate--tRNA ligase, partial [Candidatus Berkiella sp.]
NSSFSTEMELAITRKTQRHSGIAPRYPGTCRHLTPEQIAHKRATGIKPALRFRIPDNEMVQFDDFIQGPRNFATNDIGDFIIEKADGSASFMFCNAVDDALMQVTHVMRGEDHLTNTPRQLLVLKALNLPMPAYGHMPLILGFDGKPLSKRNGSQSIEALREQGYFPQAVNNYLARLGHHFENEKLLTLNELGEQFNVSHIGRSPARFDLAQLKHWQKETVLIKTEDEITKWIAPFVSPLVSNDKAAHFTQTIKQNIVLPEDAHEWAKQLLTDECIWDDDAITNLNTDAGKHILDNLQSAIEKEGDDYANVVKALTTLTGQKGKALFLPLRCAITGRSYGPELANIFTLMGKQSLLKRVELVKAKLISK